MSGKSEQAAPLAGGEGRGRPRVAKSDDIDITRIMELGLGRGIDATCDTPWLSKSSFQVRRVLDQNVLFTEEGGALHRYKTQVKSVHKQQASMRLSITVPSLPVTIAVDSELSRDVSSDRFTFGKKVLNRTISFRDHFVDITRKGQMKQAPRDDKQNLLTFEERLAAWLIGTQKPGENRVPGENIKQLLKNCNDEQLYTKCIGFLEQFRITHYVSAIELGAVSFQVMKSQELHRSQSSASQKCGREDLKLKEVASSRSEERKIGKIREDSVERDSYDEAVVGVKIQPISSLVNTPRLHSALQKALVNYTELRSDTSGELLTSTQININTR